MKTTKLLTVLALAGAAIFLSSPPLIAQDKGKESKNPKQEKQQPETRKQDKKSPKEKSETPRSPQKWERPNSMEPSVLS